MLLSTGDHIVVSEDVYGGSTALWRNHTERTGIMFTYVDARYPEKIDKAIRPETKVRKRRAALLLGRKGLNSATEAMLLSGNYRLTLQLLGVFATTLVERGR